MKRISIHLIVALVALSTTTQSLIAFDPMFFGEKTYKGDNISLEEKANAGNVEAMYQLSIKNLGISNLSRNSGYSVMNKYSAFYWANKAYENGNKDVLVRLAYLYENAIGVKKDLDKALELYIKAVEFGNTEAKVRLAFFYTPYKKNKDRLKYANKDKAKLLIADFLKDVDSQNDLDMSIYRYAVKSYLEGILCEKNLEKAVAVIEKVHKQNEELSRYNYKYNDFTNAMIFCYIRGIVVEKDKDKAKEIYNKMREGYLSTNEDFRAYELGVIDNCSAEYYDKLALSYYFSSIDNDFKVLYEDNMQKAVELYEKSGKMGYHLAYYHLGSYYFYNKDYEKSFPLLLKAFEGISERPDYEELTIICLLAQSYKEAKGTDKNTAKAIELYEKAFEYGSNQSANDLGFIYFDGDGVKQDYKKALIYLLSAAKKNKSAKIYSAIAKCYEQDSEFSLACDYYKKAIPLTYKKDPLKAKIKELSDKIGKSVVIEEKEVSLDQRAMAGDAEAMLQLAQKNLQIRSSYSIQYQNEESIKSGFYWYKKAYENGNLKAIYPLASCYAGGYGTDKDLEKAKQLYNESWKKGGDAKALLTLVKGYSYPIIMDKLINKSKDKETDDNYLTLLKIARQQDDLEAEIYGYLAKKLIKEKDAEGVDFLEKIIKNNKFDYLYYANDVEDAYIALAYCYATGTFTQKNEQKAKELVNTLGKKNPNINKRDPYIFIANLLGLYELKDANDFNAVANVYSPYFSTFSYDRILFENNKEKAIEFYEKAEALGDINAKKRVADIYRNNGEPKKAIDLYLQFAEEIKDPSILGKYINCWLYLAKAYEQGEIVEKDISKSLEFYKKISETQNSYCKNLALAKLYFYGGLLEQNYEKALKILLEDSGNMMVEGNEMLGEMYSKGLGTPKDIKKAIGNYRTLLKCTPKEKREKIKATIKQLESELADSK